MRSQLAVEQNRTKDVPVRTRLNVALFDSFSLNYRDRPITIKNKKAQALLAYLILSSSPLETRERLSGLLWSESEEHKARASLRQTLHQIRETLDEVGFEGFSLGREEVRLDKSSLDVDVWAVVEKMDTGVHPLLLDHKNLPDTLLPGFDEVDPAFRSWLLVQRQFLHGKFERQLEDALAAAGSELSSIRPIASALLNLDPTHEAACRRLMQSCAASGDIAGALRVYKNLWDVLEEDYDVEPSPETQALVVEIKMQGDRLDDSQPPVRPVDANSFADIRQRQPTGPGLQAIPAPRKFIMSINAFDCSGVGANRTHVVLGFRRELIACLVRFREWYVKDGAQKPAVVATDSAADEYCIEASALQVGDAVRLILTLRDARSELYIWSDRYQITLKNWFEAQQAIVRRIAMALNVHLSTERLARAAREQGGAPQIYDRWLRGQALIQNYNQVDWRRAADIFREIIDEVPDFAPAYSSLVQLNNSVHLVYPGVHRSREREAETLDFARTAVRLDPVDSRAQLCLAWASLMAKQYVQAEINFALAYDLNENDPWTLISAAHGYAFGGSFEQARTLATEALKLSVSPSRTHWGYQTGIRFLSSDYQGCIDAADRAIDVIPNLPGWKASALFHLGAKEAAVAEAERFIGRIKSTWFGSGPPTAEAIARWFLHLFPIRQQDDWERLRDGLAGAGVKVSGIRHHDW